MSSLSWQRLLVGRRAFMGVDDSTTGDQCVLFRPDQPAGRRWYTGPLVERPAPELTDDGGVFYDATTFPETRVQAVRRLFQDGGVPRGITVSGVGESNWQHVAAFFDASGNPVTKARSWCDSSAKWLLPQVVKQVGWMVPPGLMMMKARHVAEREPHDFARATYCWNAQAMGTREWCGTPYLSASEAMAQGWRWRLNLLTGKVTLDPDDLRWVHDRFVGMLPRIIGPGMHAGHVSEAMRSSLGPEGGRFAPGCIVVPGLSDNTATAVGAGRFCLTGGNSICGISFGLTDTAHMPAGLPLGVIATPKVPASGSLLPFGGPTGMQYLFCAVNGALRTNEYALEAATRKYGREPEGGRESAEAKQWRHEIFQEFEGRFARDRNSLRGGMTCIPFKAPERFPVWPESIMDWRDADGAFICDYDRYRLLIDSILYNALNGIELMAARGIDTSTIVVAGGIFSSPGVRQELADISNRKVVARVTPHLLAAKGAALYSFWVYLRHNGFPDVQLSDVVEHFSETDGNPVEPRQSFHQLHVVRRQEFNARLRELMGK